LPCPALVPQLATGRQIRTARNPRISLLTGVDDAERMMTTGRCPPWPAPVRSA
jgi:hypothetical protein